ncbi:MAG: ParA family protein [Fusobacterium sp.]|nr:ParA family protein [Fusobacterium sp.]
MVGILANQKGGVAKTTNTVHLAAALAQKGYKTLCIDFDSQCDLSHSVGIRNEEDFNVINFLNKESNIRLKQRAPNFFVIPGSDDFISNNYKISALKDALEMDRNGTSLRDYFDYIFIDCPPSKIIVPQNGNKKNEHSEIELALYASDFFIIPLKADDFSVKNSNKFLGKVTNFINFYDLEIHFLGFFFGCILLTENSKDYYTSLFEKYSSNEMLFQSFVRQDSQVKKAVRVGKTIFQHKPSSRSAEDYLELSKEFLKRIKE